MDSENIITRKSFPVVWEEVIIAFEQDLSRRNLSRRTITAYTDTLNAFGNFYRERLEKPGPYVSRIRENDFHSFIDYLDSTRHLTIASINRAVSALKTFSHFITSQGLHHQNIAMELKTHRQKPSLKTTPLSDNEVRKLLIAVDPNGRNGLRDLAILQLFLQCGLLLGELTRLCVKDISIRSTSGWVKVWDRKKQTEQVIQLNATARSAVKKYLETRGAVEETDALFISERGKRISDKTVQYLIKKYLCAIGRPEICIYDLKRYFTIKRKNPNETG